jgi:hypothetical protein
MTRVARPIALAFLAAALAGCGGGDHNAVPPQPKLPATLARQLAAQSDEVAAKLDAGDGCGALSSAQRLQQLTIAAINAHRVPAALQEPLSAAVNDVPTRIKCTPPPAEEKHHGHGKHKGHGGEGD